MDRVFPAGRFCPVANSAFAPDGLKTKTPSGHGNQKAQGYGNYVITENYGKYMAAENTMLLFSRASVLGIC
jgi:hypothetical protein